MICQFLYKSIYVRAESLHNTCCIPLCYMNMHFNLECLCLTKKVALTWRVAKSHPLLIILFFWKKCNAHDSHCHRMCGYHRMPPSKLTSPDEPHSDCVDLVGAWKDCPLVWTVHKSILSYILYAFARQNPMVSHCWALGAVQSCNCKLQFFQKFDAIFIVLQARKLFGSNTYALISASANRRLVKHMWAVQKAFTAPFMYETRCPGPITFFLKN
jgi:hypothetical protein